MTPSENAWSGGDRDTASAHLPRDQAVKQVLWTMSPGSGSCSHLGKGLGKEMVNCPSHCPRSLPARFCPCQEEEAPAESRGWSMLGEEPGLPRVCSLLWLPGGVLWGVGWLPPSRSARSLVTQSSPGWPRARPPREGLRSQTQTARADNVDVARPVYRA